MWGFQFWANLPASHKMMEPRYRGILSGEIPEVTLKGDVRAEGHLRRDWRGKGAGAGRRR